MSEPSRRRGRLPILLLILACGAGGYVAWRHYGVPGKPAGQQQAKAKAPPPVPVQVATAQKAAFPRYLGGLGTVQAYNTVVVRSRVDGQIEKLDFTEGQMVKAGDEIARIDARPFKAALEQAQAKKQQDEASLANAKRDLARYTNLGSFSTQQQKDTQAATVQQLTAQIAADQAAIDSAQTQLDYTTIKAPISGLTGFRQVDAGNIVNASSTTGIVTITQIEPIAVIFTAPEDRLPEITAALASHPMPVIAYTTDGSRKLSEGKLELVNNQVDTASGTVRLKAVFDNRDHALWPGQSVSTQLLIDTLQDVTVIPDGAVQHGPNGLFAYVIDASGKAAMQPITVSESGKGQAVIAKGIVPGQKVVSAGQYRVQPGVMVAERKTGGDASKEE